MKTTMKYLILLVILTLLGAPMVGALAASGTPVVTTGFDKDAIYKATVRYRNFDGTGYTYEAKLANNEIDCTWMTGNNHIVYSYDPISGILSTTITNVLKSGPQTCYTELAVGDLGGLNYIRINLKQGSKNSNKVAFNNVSIDGVGSLGNFDGTSSTAPFILNWNVKGLTLNDGFVLQGDLYLEKNQVGKDSSYVEIQVGDLGPIVSNVTVSPFPLYLNGPGRVSARINDVPTGHDIVASANYNLDGGAWQPWTPMAAEDGAFDWITENVYADFSGDYIGPHTTCVHATDINGNQGAAACHDFLVSYMFYGFDEPITMGTINLAKAGQAVPTIWRLTDHFGAGIDNPGSFVGLFSYPVACDELSDPIVVVEETASGDSGLQYLGDGYWQFNWKTPKTYSGTCRAMYVAFDSETTSPVLVFKFK